MLSQSGGIDASLLFCCEGIQLTPYAVDAVAYVVGAAVGGAFEDGMFNEVGNAFFIALFVAGAHIDVDTRMGDNGGRLAGDDAYAVGQCVILVH